MSNVVEIRGMEKEFKKFRLGAIDLSLPKGYITGLIGENGAGKSTLIRLILGLLYPTRGEVKIFGKHMSEDEIGIRERIGVVYDDLCLPFSWTGNQVSTFHALGYKKWDDKRFRRYLEIFRIDPAQKIKEYSRGMRMKMSLAIALSHDAELLLLDEPTSGLDPAAREELLDHLSEFIEDEEHTVLISSHILSDLEKIADYIAFLHEGKMVFMEEKDRLSETYRLVSCGREAVSDLPLEKILGRRVTDFGASLLMKREDVPSGVESEIPSVEEIMVYIVRGDRHEGIVL